MSKFERRRRRNRPSTNLIGLLIGYVVLETAALVCMFQELPRWVPIVIALLAVICGCRAAGRIVPLIRRDWLLRVTVYTIVFSLTFLGFRLGAGFAWGI